jgi:hypothetical protein
VPITTRILASVAITLGVMITSAATAQSGSRGIASLVSQTNFTPTQLTNIETFTGDWASQLATGTDVRRARRELITPLAAPGVTPIFRQIYTAAVLDDLAKVVDEQEEISRAINAIQVMGHLGSRRAQSWLLDHLDVEVEPRMPVRLWSAIAFRRSLDQGQIEHRSLLSQLRSVHRAIDSEPHWLVIMRDFELLKSVTKMDLSDLPGGDAIKSQAQSLQLDALESLLNRVTDESAPANDLINAVRPALMGLRSEYLDYRLTASAQRAFGLALAKQLGRVYDASTVHFESAQDSEHKNAYGSSLQLAEELLKLIDGQLRGADTVPRTSSITAWENGDQAVIETNGQTWSAVLSRPPYK